MSSYGENLLVTYKVFNKIFCHVILNNFKQLTFYMSNELLNIF